MGLVNKLLFGDTDTVIPWKINMCIFSGMFLYSSTTTMVFSYMPKLIKSFGTSEVDTGYKVGLVAGSMYFTRTFTSLIWGSLADVYGRKELYLISGLCLSITTLAFGFSNNLEWLIVARILQGSSMGLYIMSKGIIVDMSDDASSIVGMTFIQGAYSLGSLLGPVVGGFFAFPDKTFPGAFDKDSMFGKYPILLPNFVISTAFLMAMSLSFIYLPNTKQKTDHVDSQQVITIEKEHLIKPGESSDHINVTNANQVKVSKWKITYFRNSRYIKLLSNRKFNAICVLYGLWSMYGSGIDELFPLYAATIKEYNGLEFEASQIGTTLMIIALVVLVLQFTLMPRIVWTVGLRKCFFGSCMFCCVTTPLIPICGHITSKNFFWPALLTIMITVRFTAMMAYLCVSIMLNNSVNAALAGTANGVGAAATTICRFIAVTVLGSIYGWSLTNIKSVESNINVLGFPFNEYFSFFVLSAVVALNGVYSLFIPESLQYKLVVNN